MNYMDRLKKVKTEQALYLVYELEENESVDYVSLGMMSNNTITGLAHVQLIQMNQERQFRFKMTSEKTMCEFLSESQNKETNLKLIKNIVLTMKRIEEYMIPENQVSLCCDNIYVGEDGKVEMLCVPIVREKNIEERETLTALFKYCNEKFVDQQGSVYWEMSRVLEKDNVTLNDFLKEIEKKEQELLVVDEGGPFVLLRSDRKKNENNGPVILSRDKKSDVAHSNSVVLTRSDRIDNKQTEQKKPENPNVVILKGRIRENTRKTVHEDTEENLHKNEIDYEGTADMEENTVKAYLIRRSTEEKILISKSVFVIGKDRTSTDYRVDNNPVVSRNHAIIMRVEHDYYIVDTNSKNHVYVNGTMIAPNQKVKLVPYSAVRLANEEFTFMVDGV